MYPYSSIVSTMLENGTETYTLNKESTVVNNVSLSSKYWREVVFIINNIPQFKKKNPCKIHSYLKNDITLSIMLRFWFFKKENVAPFK